MDGITFGEAVTTTLATLKPGDFVVSFPDHMGVRGRLVNSGIKTMIEGYDTWVIRHRPVRSFAVGWLSSLAPVDLPADFPVIARRISNN